MSVPQPSTPASRVGSPALPVVALGDPGDVGGLALAGVQVWPATTTDEVRSQWARLPEAAVVLVTPAVAQVLDQRSPERADAAHRLTVVLPA